MKKVLLGFLAVIVALVAGVCIAASFQPDRLEVERSHEIRRGVVDLLPYLTDLHRWTEWSPWEDLDPNMTKEFSEPASGVGAWYSWAGNDDVGSGKMTITAIEGNAVTYDLEFLEPFESRAIVKIVLVEDNGSTRVTWSMDSPNAFMGKVFGLFMNMDEMVGADFEHGLANLEREATGSGG